MCNCVNQFGYSFFLDFSRKWTTFCKQPLCRAPRVVAYERVDCKIGKPLNERVPETV